MYFTNYNRVQHTLINTVLTIWKLGLFLVFFQELLRRLRRYFSRTHSFACRQGRRKLRSNFPGKVSSSDHMASFNVFNKFINLGHNGVSIGHTGLNLIEMILLHKALKHASKEFDRSLDVGKAVRSLVN